MTASDSRRLVLHADDLGMSRRVSEGILQGFRGGPLTSASLLSNGPDAARALQRWGELCTISSPAIFLPLRCATGSTTAAGRSIWAFT